MAFNVGFAGECPELVQIVKANVNHEEQAIGDNIFGKTNAPIISIALETIQTYYDNYSKWSITTSVYGSDVQNYSM